MEAVVDVAVKYPAVRLGVPVATRLEPFQVRSPLVKNPAVLSPTLPEVGIVPPVSPLFVAILVTVPFPVPAHVPSGIKKQPLDN